MYSPISKALLNPAQYEIHPVRRLPMRRRELRINNLDLTRISILWVVDVTSKQELASSETRTDLIFDDREIESILK